MLSTLTLKCNATSTHSPHSQQVLLHLLTYVRTQGHQVTLGPHVTITCLVLRHWYNMSQQCYTTSNLHHNQFPAPTSPVEPFQTESALLQWTSHLLSLHPAWRSNSGQKHAQPTNTTDTQCAESATTISQYSTLETNYHMSADSLATGPCLPQGWKCAPGHTTHSATQTCRVHTTCYNKQHTYTQHMHRTQMICTSYHHQQPSSTLSMGGSIYRRGQNEQLTWTQ